MYDRVFSKLGITDSDLTWRNNSYRPDTLGGVKRRKFGSGISANVNAMAKIRYLYLRRDKFGDRQIIPESFVRAVSRPFPEIIGLPVHDSLQCPNASDHYGLLWWNNGDGILNNVPRDGTEVAKDTQPGLLGSDKGLYIGTGGAMLPGTYWSGLIDDIRIYDRAVRP
jgi:CubicO group peptidase (beta-lactamase class C family)